MHCAIGRDIEERSGHSSWLAAEAADACVFSIRFRTTPMCLSAERRQHRTVPYFAPTTSPISTRRAPFDPRYLATCTEMELARDRPDDYRAKIIKGSDSLESARHKS
jgi:hypothetical protein